MDDQREDQAPRVLEPLEKAYALVRAEIDEFQSKSLERIAKSSHPLNLLLVEAFCLELFDREARTLFSLAAGLPASEIDEHYGNGLVVLKNNIRDWLKRQFGESMSVERKKIYYRTVGLLESKRLHWQAKGRRAAAGRVTVAQSTEADQPSRPTEMIRGAASSSASGRNVEPAKNTLTQQPSGKKKPGPRTGYAEAVLLAEVVARVAPDGDWRSKVDEICAALDDAELPIPKVWRHRRKHRAWVDAERSTAVRIIAHRLRLAKEAD